MKISFFDFGTEVKFNSSKSQAVYPLWWLSLTKDLQAENPPCWSGMTDTEHSTTSGSNEKSTMSYSYIVYPCEFCNYCKFGNYALQYKNTHKSCSFMYSFICFDTISRYSIMLSIFSIQTVKPEEVLILQKIL